MNWGWMMTMTKMATKTKTIMMTVGEGWQRRDRPSTTFVEAG
jgi:hypothetical protein